MQRVYASLSFCCISIMLFNSLKWLMQLCFILLFRPNDIILRDIAPLMPSKTLQIQSKTKGIISRLWGINSYKSYIYSPEPRDDVVCLEVNFNISKLVYGQRRILAYTKNKLRFNSMLFLLCLYSILRIITGADPGFFLGGCAPLRNGVADW